MGLYKWTIDEIFLAFLVEGTIGMWGIAWYLKEKPRINGHFGRGDDY